MEDSIKKYEYKTIIVEGLSEDSSIELNDLTELQDHYADGWEPVLVVSQTVTIADKYHGTVYGPVLYTLRKIKTNMTL